MMSLMLLHPVAAMSYIRANQQLIARVADNGAVDYYQLDAFNNVRSVFNDSGFKEMQDYLPFGKSLYQTTESFQHSSSILEWITNLYGHYMVESG